MSLVASIHCNAVLSLRALSHASATSSGPDRPATSLALDSSNGSKVQGDMKICVSFPVAASALTKCIDANRLLVDEFGSAIEFGDGGNSRPHLTIAMGRLSSSQLVELVTFVVAEASLLTPFVLGIGAAEWRADGYVVCPALVPPGAGVWRRHVQAGLSSIFGKSARVSLGGHVTLAFVDDAPRARAVPDLPLVATCEVAQVDVSLAGPRGVLSEQLHSAPLGSINYPSRGHKDRQ